jgi:hypothetical protein
MVRVRRLSGVFLLAVSLWLLAACSSNDSGGNGSGSSANDKYASDRQACVDRINGFRATLNLPPLKRWNAEESCTDGQAKSDSESGKAHGAFGACMEHAQDECPGWGSVQDTIQGCLQDMWNEGPGTDFSKHGHFLNMSSTDSTQVACGFYETPDGKVWAVQNFR